MLPKNRPPTHPGELLREEFLKPLGMTQTELARRIRVSFPRINEIINEKRGITPDTALRLSRLFSTPPEFWLNGQRNWDLWHALNSDTADALLEIDRSAQPRARRIPAHHRVARNLPAVDRQAPKSSLGVTEALDSTLSSY